MGRFRALLKVARSEPAQRGGGCVWGEVFLSHGGGNPTEGLTRINPLKIERGEHTRRRGVPKFKFHGIESVDDRQCDYSTLRLDVCRAVWKTRERHKVPSANLWDDGL